MKFIKPYFCSSSNCVTESVTHFAETGNQWKLMILLVIYFCYQWLEKTLKVRKYR